MIPTVRFVVASLAAWAFAWGGYDLYVVARYGLGSGRTISWAIYSGSLHHPAYPFLGCLTFGLLCGHFFLAGKTPNVEAVPALAGLLAGLLAGWYFLGMSGE